MKILITTDWYKPVINGVVTSVVSLADGLTASGHEVRILTLSGNSHSRREGNVTYIGSISVGNIYPNARMKTAPSSKYVREIIDWKPDVVHSQCEFSTFFLAKKIAEVSECPLIHTYHTVYEDFTHYFSPSVRFGKYLAATLSKKILDKTQGVVVPTAKIKSMLEGYSVQTPISVIPSGLELDQFGIPVVIPERRSMRASLGISDTDKVLIYLGRLAQEKNIDELLTLIQQQNNPQLKLLLVGDGPYRTHLEDTVNSLGLASQVIFAGMVAPSQVARYYSLGDIFVSASQSETQGLTYIEAMASGLPLLCHDDPCLNDVISNGENGFIYRNNEEFRARLNQLLSDTDYRLAMGAAARATAFNSFSSKGFAEKMEEIYIKQIQLKRTEQALPFMISCLTETAAVPDNSGLYRGGFHSVNSI